MPTDARIPLSALGNAPPPIDLAGTIYRSQAAHAMQADAQRKAAEAQKQQQIDALASQYDDPEEYIQAVSRIDPLAARKFGEQYEKHKNETLEGYKRKLEVDGKKLDYYMRILPDDPDQYAIWRQGIVQTSPDYDAILPPPEQWVDPAVRQRVKMMGASAMDQVKAQQDLTNDIRDGKYQRGLARFASLAPSIEVWRSYATEMRGLVPKAELAAIDQVIASAPSFEAAKPLLERIALTAEQEAQASSRDETAERLLSQFEETQRHNRATEAASAATNARLAAGGGDNEPLVPIVGPDGKPVLVRRSQAEGKTPASTRDSGGGRGVTSGDANRIADFDTSLDDTKVLRTAISGNKATGMRAAAGAALWNPITELTGWGADAKAKQALIDRVKQVIGKAFEGGVLRKEDEAKYAKILPTISDPTSLVISKLDGLDSAIVQRRSTLIDSLDDAGYNVESYKTRGPRKPADTTTGGPKVGERRKFGDKIGQWDGTQWVQVSQ